MPATGCSEQNKDKAVGSIRKNYNEISKLCKESGEPIYLAKNGEGDLVVIDIYMLMLLPIREILNCFLSGESFSLFILPLINKNFFQN